MEQKRSFVASLVAAVGSFMLLPLSFYWFFVALEEVGGRNSFFYVAFMVMFVLALAIFVTETIAAIRLAKGKTVSKVYSVVTMALNALLVVFAIINLVILLIDFGGFNFEIFIMLCMYYLAYVFAAATSGVSFAYKLIEMLKKN